MANQNQNQNRNRSSNGVRPAQKSGTTPVPTMPKPEAKPAAKPDMPNSGNSNKDGRKLTPKQEAMRRRQAIRRRNRAIVIGLVGLVTLVAAGLIIYSVTQPLKFDSLPAQKTADNAIPLDAGLTAVDDRFTKGATDAKVVVTEYGDFQCPACRSFFESTEKNLFNDYVKTGKVKFVFSNYAFLDQGRAAQESHVAAEAAYCASDQKRFWDFHDALYLNQLPENTGKLTTDRMKQLASQLGLNTDTFNKCVDDRKYKSAVLQDYTQGTQKGVSATPTIMVNGEATKTNGYEDIKAAIEKALAAK